MLLQGLSRVRCILPVPRVISTAISRPFAASLETSAVKGIQSARNDLQVIRARLLGDIDHLQQAARSKELETAQKVTAARYELQKAESRLNEAQKTRDARVQEQEQQLHERIAEKQSDMARGGWYSNIGQQLEEIRALQSQVGRTHTMVDEEEDKIRADIDKHRKDLADREDEYRQSRAYAAEISKGPALFDQPVATLQSPATITEPPISTFGANAETRTAVGTTGTGTGTMATAGTASNNGAGSGSSYNNDSNHHYSNYTSPNVLPYVALATLSGLGLVGLLASLPRSDQHQADGGLTGKTGAASATGAAGKNGMLKLALGGGAAGERKRSWCSDHPKTCVGLTAALGAASVYLIAQGVSQHKDQTEALLVSPSTQQTTVPLAVQPQQPSSLLHASQMSGQNQSLL